MYRPYEESFAESSDGGVAKDTLVVRTTVQLYNARDPVYLGVLENCTLVVHSRVA